MAGGKSDKQGYFCSECGNESVRWFGKCPACGVWNSLAKVPTRIRGRGMRSSWLEETESRPILLEDVDEAGEDRIRTGLDEFDRVLGGGVVRGSFVLLGGPPGIGKSTILKQVAARLNTAGERVLYVSGEESASQVKIRARRLGPDALRVTFLAETNVDDLIAHAEVFEPTVLVIDSIQTLYGESVEGAPGNLTQIRHTATTLLRFSKAQNISVFIVGHVTKDGHLAGPRVLEHMVDTVIYFEHTGDFEHRLMRAVKNRYGSADEIGVFRMSEKGLIQVTNPSKIFLADRALGTPGSAVTSVIEGTRPLLVEVQGLASISSYGSPQRIATGFSRKRLAILLAVLERRVRIPFGQLDAFVNVVGGMRLTEPSVDAAVVAALASSVYDRSLPEGALFIGEVGLGGELRQSSRLERRLAEAASMGFTKVYAPIGSRRISVPAGIEVIGVSNVKEMLHEVLGGLGPPSEAGARASNQRKQEKQSRRREGRSRRTALALG